MEGLWSLWFSVVELRVQNVAFEASKNLGP